MAIFEGKTIGEVLKIRRLDLARTDKAMSVIAMGRILKDAYEKSGRTGTWINNLELGNGSDIMVLLPEVRLHLLQLYSFTPAEIADLDERFSLKLPKDAGVKNPTPTRLSHMGSLESITLRVLGIPASEGYTVHKYVLEDKNVDADKAFVLQTTGDTLACPEVKARYDRPFRLLFNEALAPEEGQITAYRVKGEDTYVLKVHHDAAPVHPVVVVSYDGIKSIVLYPDDPELELLGTIFAAHEML